MNRFGSPPSRLLRAFTLMELLVVVAIVALLIAILVPTLSNARQQAVKAQCLSNVRQIGMGFATYTSEYDELPMSFNWGYTPPSLHPLHYPGQQSGLLALEQTQKFKRDYLICPKGWAHLNRGQNWYTNSNEGDTGSANMDYMYWGWRFKPGNSYSVTVASFRYRYRTDENMKILVTDLVQDMTGITAPPQIANRFYGNHNDGPTRIVNKTDGKGLPATGTVKVIARGGSVLFSDNHAEWFAPERFTQVNSSAAFPPPDQW